MFAITEVFTVAFTVAADFALLTSSRQMEDLVPRTNSAFAGSSQAIHFTVYL